MMQVIPMRDYLARCEALAKKTWQLTYEQALRHTTLLIVGLQLFPEFIHLCGLCCDELIYLTVENLHCAKWVEKINHKNLLHRRNHSKANGVNNN